MSEEYDQPKGGEQGTWGEGDGPNLRLDDFVGRIVQDPNQPPSVTLLSGYLGASSEEGHVRLYLDEELSNYVEIPEKAIRHTQELPPEQSPLGGSLIWIDQDAEVLHGAAGSERRKATFLEGQIAQDYIGGPGGYGDLSEGGGTTTTQTKDCRGGIGILPTDMGPGCWQSVYQPCIPPTELPGCRTRTGILCTLIGPSCRTRYPRQCPSVYLAQCHSIASPCVTVHEPRCVESGFVCNPIDFTIWEEQFSPQAGFAARRGGVGGFDPNIGVFQTGFNCPSVFDNCATQESFCPTQNTCPSQLVICQSQFGDCITRSGCVSRIIRCPTVNFNCPSVSFRCPTRGEPRCFASRVAICPDTQAGCQVQSVACGIDEVPGGDVMQQNIGQVQMRGQVAIQQTRLCPSQLTICPSRLIFRCRTRSPWECFPTHILLCNPTRYNCPTMPNGCPGYTQFGSCETFGGCPSAVDACPTRFGCESQVGCAESIACQSQGCFPGGGGFDPAGGGGGFAGGGGGGFAGGAGGGAEAQGFRAAAFAPQPTPETVYCAAGGGGVGQNPWVQTVNYCAVGGGGAGVGAFIPPTRYSCQSRSYRCPSAVDACPTRFGCFETQVCQVSQACFPQGGGGGFGGGGFGGGF